MFFQFELRVLEEGRSKRRGFGFAAAQCGKRFQSPVATSGPEIEARQIPLRNPPPGLRGISAPPLKFIPRQFSLRAIQLIQFCKNKR